MNGRHVYWSALFKKTIPVKLYNVKCHNKLQSNYNKFVGKKKRSFNLNAKCFN